MCELEADKCEILHILPSLLLLRPILIVYESFGFLIEQNSGLWDWYKLCIQSLNAFLYATCSTLRSDHSNQFDYVEDDDTRRFELPVHIRY